MDAEFNVFTDYNQFTVSDPTADFNDLYQKWTDETVESMFVQGDRYIAVGTMRNFYAPVLIHLNSEHSFTGSVDKTATGFLDVPSGVLEVSGPTDNGLSTALYWGTGAGCTRSSQLNPPFTHRIRGQHA